MNIVWEGVVWQSLVYRADTIITNTAVKWAKHRHDILQGGEEGTAVAAVCPASR